MSGVPPPVASGRRREAGQALVMALLALLLASLAASLVAMDLGIRQRAMRDEAVRAHLQALLDGALAEALARLAAGSAAGESLAWSAPPGVGARSGATVGRRRGHQLQVWVWATWAGRWGGAEADVLQRPGEAPRVTAWRRIPAATAAALAP